MRIFKKEESQFQYISSLKTVISKSWSQGIGDSLGRTARAALIYDEDREALIEGVQSYYQIARSSPETGDHVYVTRYPGDVPIDYLRGNSRDHVLISISCLKMLGEDDFVKWFIKNRAKRPCIDHGYPISQKLWFKALYSKFWSWIYAIVEIPYLLLMLIWNFIGKILTWTWKSYKTVPEYYEALQAGKIKPLRKWQRWLADIALFPTYAMFYGALSANAIESKWASKLVGFFYSLLFEKHNYVGKALCGKKIPAGAFENWVPSRKNRWSIRLDRTCNRDMKPYPNDRIEENIELAGLKYYSENI